jgi:integrase
MIGKKRLDQLLTGIKINKMMKIGSFPKLFSGAYREMKQTRHSFATNALNCGENPLWIAKVMGHRDTDMIIKVYGKYIEDAGGRSDGSKLDGQYNGLIGKLE